MQLEVIRPGRKQTHVIFLLLYALKKEKTNEAQKNYGKQQHMDVYFLRTIFEIDISMADEYVA